MSSKLKKLGSLADIYQSEHLDGTITKVRIENIHPSADQPRQDRTFAVDELANSIRRDGLLSPIVITRDGEGYRIIAGERRFHAARQLGWTEIEARIISRKEMDYWRIAIIENLQRENLSPEEEASALLKLKSTEDMSDASLAELVGKSRNYITEILGIGALPPTLLKECRSAGIETRNLLIQVVQAHKKGVSDEFLAAYRAGQIHTVREARDFNQNREPTKQQATPKEDPSSTGEEGSLYSMKTRGNLVSIQCPTSKDAKNLAEWLKKQYPPLSKES